MNKPDRDNQAVKQAALRANGCIIRVHYNLPGLRFARHLQVVRRKTGEVSPYFHRYSECIRWAIGDRIWVQGHWNVLHTRADDYIRAMKDYGEYSPWFKELDDLVRWLEIVPYDSRRDDKLTVSECYSEGGPAMRQWRKQPVKPGWHWVWDTRSDEVKVVRIEKINLIGLCFRDNRQPMECSRWPETRFLGPLREPKRTKPVRVECVANQ